MSMSSDSEDVPRVCGVCGAKAFGYNFNAITCESCKAFFRRNALKEKEFKCPFSGSCIIDTVTRRFCQKCRLQKCHRIGMRKDWILSEEQKKSKRHKIAVNRARRCEQGRPSRQSSLTTAGPSPAAEAMVSPASTVVISDDVSSPEKRVWLEDSVEHHHRLDESPCKRPRCSDDMCLSSQDVAVESADTLAPELSCLAAPSPPAPVSCLVAQTEAPAASSSCSSEAVSSSSAAAASSSRPDLVQMCDVGIQASAEDDTADAAESISMSCVLQMALRAEFCDTWLRDPVLPSGDLNSAERHKISELLEAQQALMAPLNEDNLFVNLVNADPSLINVINLCDVAIRRLVKMSKQISSFRGLCQRDQIALLKGGCTELMILHSVTTYDPENNTWNIPANEKDYTSIHLNVLKKAPYDVYEAHKRFNQTFSHGWKTDPYIMGLLTAITLFSPARPNVEHVDAIRVEQESYYYLLRRYLLRTMERCQAQSEFLRLIRKMHELHRLNEDHVKIFMDVNPHDVEPLLIEIFDLKGQPQQQLLSPGGQSANYSCAAPPPELRLKQERP